MSDLKCPLCGKDVKDGEEFCKDCQDIAHYSYPTNFVEESETILQEKVVETSDIGAIDSKADYITVKKSRKSTILTISVLIICIAIGAVVSYFYIQKKKAKEAEIAYWEQSATENTPLSYSQYLIQYPKGKFSNDAHQKITELEDKEKQDWINLQKSTDINAYFSFLLDHPNTPYEKEIRLRMDSISWQTTTATNTAESYLAYLENVKLGNMTGNFKSQAEERYNYLSELKNLDGAELILVRKHISHFFELLASNKFKDVEKQMAPSLTHFFDLKNKSKEAIIKSIESDLKSRKIKNITYSFEPDSLEIILDNKGVYFLSLPIQKTVVYKDRKKKKETSSHFIKMELNNKKELMSLYETRSKK